MIRFMTNVRIINRRFSKAAIDKKWPSIHRDKHDTRTREIVETNMKLLPCEDGGADAWCSRRWRISACRSLSPALAWISVWNTASSRRDCSGEPMLEAGSEWPLTSTGETGGKVESKLAKMDEGCRSWGAWATSPMRGRCPTAKTIMYPWKLCGT